MRIFSKALTGALIACSILLSCNKNIPDIDSNSGLHFYINSGDERLSKVVKVNDGLVYVGMSENDGLVMKVNAEGKQQWIKHIDFGATEIFFDATGTYDGGIVAVGQTNPHGSHQNSIITKLDGNGNVVWSYWYPDSIYGTGLYSVKEDKDHNLWIGGYFNVGGTYYLFHKLDPNANTIFTRYYSGAYLNFIKSIDFNNQGDAVLGALSSPSALVTEIRKYQVNTVVVTSDSGNVIAYHDYPYFNRPEGVDINVNHLSLFAKPNGYVHFATWQRPSDSLNTILFVDADLYGNVRNTRQLNGLGSAKFLNARMLEDGSYIVTGETSEGVFNYTKALVMNVSRQGSVIWESYVGGEDKRIQANNAYFENGRWLVAGAVTDQNQGYSRLMYYHLDESGNLLFE